MPIFSNHISFPKFRPQSPQSVGRSSTSFTAGLCARLFGTSNFIIGGLPLGYIFRARSPILFPKFFFIFSFSYLYPSSCLPRTSTFFFSFLLHTASLAKPQELRGSPRSFDRLAPGNLIRQREKKSLDNSNSPLQCRATLICETYILGPKKPHPSLRADF